MKPLTLILISFFIVCSSQAQQVSKYMLDVNIHVPGKEIHVEGNIDIDFGKSDSIELILWKNSTILAMSDNVKFSFDTVSPSPSMYIPDGRKLVLTNLSLNNKQASVHIEYTCDMDKLAGWGRSFTEDWIEMGFYCAWYPLEINSRDFTAGIHISIDQGYIVSGSGIISRKSNSDYHMVQEWDSSDIVIIASKGLKTRTLSQKDTTIDIVYTEYPENDMDSLVTATKKVLQFYESIYPAQEDAYMKFVVSPAGSQGGYSRKNFISLRTQKYDLFTCMGIAHETAHFWWRNADTSTWEDWLNEAFAEYSMLMFVRDEYGTEVFNGEIERYRKNTANIPPVYGIDRDTPEAYAALYEKGALILYEFETRVGKERFLHFLSLVLENGIKTTQQFLNFVKEEYGEENSTWFEHKLKS